MTEPQDLARAHWPAITAAPELFMQRENVVFRVATSEGPHALRLHRPGYHAEAELRSELDVMAMLAGHGVRVPRPMPSRDGRLLVQLGNRQASLLSWLPGQPMGRSGQPLALEGSARGALFHAIGAQMARLHVLADAWALPPGFSRPRWDKDGLVGERPFWGRFWDLPNPFDRAWALALRHRALAMLDEAPQQDIGLIHADLVNENVLVDGANVHFIDFDDMGFGYRLFDLATTLYKAVDEPDFPDLQAALLAGYATERPLPDLRLLPMFVVLRSLTYLGWIAPRADVPGMEERAARYLSIARRVSARYLA